MACWNEVSNYEVCEELILTVGGSAWLELEPRIFRSRPKRYPLQIVDYTLIFPTRKQLL